MEWTFECRYCLNPNCLKCWSSSTTWCAGSRCCARHGWCGLCHCGWWLFCGDLGLSGHPPSNITKWYFEPMYACLCSPWSSRPWSPWVWWRSRRARPLAPPPPSRCPQCLGTQAQSPRRDFLTWTAVFIHFGLEFLFSAYFPFLFLVTDWEESDKKLWSLLRNFSFTRI